MITISLCMIVKNEEAVIGRCLDSVSALVEEIIIIDTGSIDRTKEICRQYTDRVVDFQWIEHFAAARNFSFQIPVIHELIGIIESITWRQGGSRIDECFIDAKIALMK
ncbi:glycosyltransferase [Sporosarcina sp. PTS2304]|nr:glycosyltransferase [Sporosarcina sp. PTS2304]